MQNHTAPTSGMTVSDPAYYTAAMSYAEWKREPTTTQVLFGPQLPYRPPRSFIGEFLWRRRVWVEVTFALSMLEPWEKVLTSECLLPSPLPPARHILSCLSTNPRSQLLISSTLLQW